MSGGNEDLAENILNIAVPPLWKKSGVSSFDDQGGRTAYNKAVDKRLLFALRAFQPDLILISAGFDGGVHDVGNNL